MSVATDPSMKLERIRLYVEIAKTLLAIAGALLLFSLIQRPESALNREASRESIARERARLLLDWIREPDPQKRGEALGIISAAYGDSNEWLKAVESVLQQKARYESLERLILQKQMALEALQQQYVLEIAGKGPSGRYGQGPVAQSLRAQIDRIDIELRKLTERKSENAQTTQETP